MSPKKATSKSEKEKAVVLLSGGLDSTVSLVAALQNYDVTTALTFNYGQRAWGKEIRASRLIAEYYGITHEIVPLPWLANLLPEQMRINSGAYKRQKWGQQGSDAFFDAQPVWVPNRNGVMLNIAASYAEAKGATVILFGANAEEAERFPDNTEAFRVALNQSLSYSTLNQVRLECPVGNLDKPQIVALAGQLEAPLQLIWSCYGDDDVQCGQCPSCFRLKQALQHAKKKPALVFAS